MATVLRHFESATLVAELKAFYFARKNVGAFGRVFPDRKSGAWELIGRYSYLNLDSDGIQGGVLHDWTAGVNCYLTPYSRFMFNYIAANLEGFDVEHIVQVRLQVNL